jgi:hypothetical protein
MGAPLVLRVDNATPIILNCEKSIALGILGTLSPWRFDDAFQSTKRFLDQILVKGKAH